MCNDINSLTAFLKQRYNLKLLNKLKIFKDDIFKYNFSSFSVVPSFDFFSKNLSAIRLRNLYPSKIKEIEISNKRELNPLPYGTTIEKLKAYDTFYFTEGHIDALSLGIENFIAVEGVNSFNPFNFSFFKDKTIIFSFDNDRAGIESTKRLSQIAKKFNITTKQLYWDKKYGQDINQLLINKNLDKSQLSIWSNLSFISCINL